MRGQYGITMTGFLVTAVILILVALLGFKIGPAYMEYYTIKKQIKLVADEVPVVDRRTIENAYDRRAAIENITAISPKDLEISKDGDKIIISVDYSVKVPLFGNLSACMDFSASSDK